MIIQRIIQKNIEKHLFLGVGKQVALIIYGPRQAGKTTLLKAILAKHPQKALYVNCDLPDNRTTFAYNNSPNFGSLLKDIKLLLLDEAQLIENIGLVIKIIVDEHPEVQVIATGSSSFDLSNKIVEPLTGRKREFYLWPFAFEELHGQKDILQKQRNIERFLRFGGYPRAALASEREAVEILRELTGSYLYKDIFTFQDLRRPELITRLLQLLAFQIGQEVSFLELARKLEVDQSVVQRYIQLLESAFVIFRLPAYKRNLRSEVAKTRKIYFWDLGIRNTLIQNTNILPLRDDVGKLWENFLVAERLKFLRNHDFSFNFYFWRTYGQKEIDYIEEREGRLKAYEIKWGQTKKSKRPEEFFKAYPQSQWEVISPENFLNFITQALRRGNGDMTRFQ